MVYRSYYSIMIDQTIHYDQSDVRSNLHCVKFDRSKSIMINQTNAICSIGCLINQSNIFGSIRSSIDPMILS
jgi:hypothetical protein